MMNEECNNNLLRTMEMAEELNKLADKGFADSTDDDCILLYGIIKDCSYKIKTETEKEISSHKKVNKWV